MMQTNPNYGVYQGRSSTFRGFKITLIVLQILNIIGAIILIALGFVALGVADDQKDPKAVRTGSIVLIASGIIAILISVIGLIGANKENFVLIVVYGVIILLISIGNFVVHSFWYAVINMIVAGIAFYFAYLIRKEVFGQNMA